MESIQILLVEDEESLAAFVTAELTFEGYQVTHIADGETAWQAFYENNQKWDVIILDWMLPKLNGLEICRRIRKTSQVPIILMTARDYIGDKVAGLDGGADDYITKPFEIEELLARIRVIVRRQEQLDKNTTKHIYQVEDLILDLKKRSVQRYGQTFQLTQREFDLLAALMQNVGIVMSRDGLLTDVWGYDYIGQTNIVDVYIRHLRSKIDTGEGKTLLHTIRGIGYVLRVQE